MKKILIFFVLLSAFGNTVLRPDIDSDVTLYRIVAPLLCVAIFFWRVAFAIKLVVTFLFFLLYSILLAWMYSADFSQFIPSIVHYGYIFLLYLIIWYLKSLDQEKFEANFYELMTRVVIFIFIFIAFEFLFGVTFPNLYALREGGMPALRAFYWNQNDLAVVFGAFAWLLFANRKVKFSLKMSYAILSLIIMGYNGSKSAIIAFFVIILLSNADFISRRIRNGKFWTIGFVTVVTISIVTVFLFLGNNSFTTSQGTYSLNSMFQEPFRRILSLEPTGKQWGSISNRTDATIFVLIEYFKSYGFGLGPGGSWLVLTLPQYELGGAKSPHNALLQFIVDFGYPVLFGYMIMFYKAIKVFFKNKVFVLERVRAVAVISFPILGLSQSGAIVTNYTFISIVIFLFLADKYRFESFVSKKR